MHFDKRCLIIPRTDLDKIYLINLSYSTYSSVGGSTAVARHGADLNSSLMMEMEAPRIDGVAQRECVWREREESVRWRNVRRKQKQKFIGTQGTVAIG